MTTGDDYDRALKFLLGRINYERALRMPYRKSTLKLQRMRELLDRLGNPQDDLQIAHVAGSKGKGSTTLFLESILRTAGYRVGSFTSPHLHRVEERFRVDGAPCSQQQFVALCERLRQVVRPMDHEAERHGWAGPTYFELTTALAILLFAESRTDYSILEVGLGGRLDSTNVCHPVVTLITSISRDHTKQLGESLAEIAAEKAGIIKHGIPVISGVTEEVPGVVIADFARRHEAPLDVMGRDFGVTVHRPSGHRAGIPAGGTEGPSGTRFDYWQRRADGQRQTFPKVTLAVLGSHQARNAALAWRAAERLQSQGARLGETELRRGLAATRLPARIEQLADRPVVIVDTAHNVASIGALCQTLREAFHPQRRHVLLAVTRDKEAVPMLRGLAEYFDAIHCTQYRNNPRAVPAETLYQMAHQALAGSHRRPALHLHPDARQAWATLCQSAGPEDLLCITGSFFIAAELRRDALGA